MKNTGKIYGKLYKKGKKPHEKGRKKKCRKNRYPKKRHKDGRRPGQKHPVKPKGKNHRPERPPCARDDPYIWDYGQVIFALKMERMYEQDAEDYARFAIEQRKLEEELRRLEIERQRQELQREIERTRLAWERFDAIYGVHHDLLNEEERLQALFNNPLEDSNRDDLPEVDG